MVVVVELATVDVVEEDSVGVAVVAFSVEVVSELEDTSSPPSLERAIELILSLFHFSILQQNIKSGKFHPSLFLLRSRRLQPR